MRRLAGVLIVVSLTVVTEAGPGAQSAEPPAAATITVKVGASVKVRGGDLTVGLVRVASDSRCPVEAKCITAGDAAVVLSLRQGRAAAAEVTVHTMAAPREVTRGAWRIQVVDLLPQPSLRQPTEPRDYVATLRVEPVQ